MEGLFRDLGWFVLVSLAVYRLTFLITIDSGPARIFFNMREKIIRKFGPDSWQAEGIGCPLCVSVWFSAAAVAICFPWAGIVTFAVMWFGMACISLLIHLKFWRRSQ